MRPASHHEHSARHAFTSFNPRVREGLNVFSRRSMLKAGLAGLAGLTLPDLLRLRAEAADGTPIKPWRLAAELSSVLPDDTLVVKVCAYETPFYSTTTLHFDGDQAVYDRETNVGFGSTKSPQLIGRAE
jgi:hypothetical protein